MSYQRLFSAILIVLLFQSCNNKSEISQMSQFKGLWKLYSHEIKDNDGNWIPHNWMS